jgi:hypothetical protein
LLVINGVVVRNINHIMAMVNGKTNHILGNFLLRILTQLLLFRKQGF